VGERCAVCTVSRKSASSPHTTTHESRIPPVTDRDWRATHNAHWQLAYRGLVEGLGGEWRRFGGVDAMSTPSVPATVANGAIVVEQATAADLAAANEWVRAPGVPYSFRIDTALGDELLNDAAALGLKRGNFDYPAMVLEPIPTAPAPAPGVTAARVDDLLYDDFIRVLIQTGIPAQMAESAFQRELTGDDSLAFFVAHLDGKPAGTSLLVRTDDVSGIYAVGTVDDARRRGVGTAATWAAVEQARAWGSSAVLLQATAMGYPIYAAIGFRTITQIASLGWPKAPTN
jgi:GNAT superfamily N-acetyltransferase